MKRSIPMLSLLRALAPWSAVVSLAALALSSAELGAREARAESAATEALAIAPAPAGQAPILARAASRPAAVDDSKPSCPQSMVLVEGNYCPEVEQRCLRWLDGTGRFAHYRCAEYAPSKCASKERRAMRFCIDRDEHRADGQALPENNVSLTDAAKSCAAEGKRVCRESEWNFACEGEEMRPYPYGFRRDASACNADHTDLVDADGKLKDMRSPPGSHPRCTSPFGVRDMAGNLEEMVARDGPGPLRTAMKGAYWQPSKNHCRAAQTSHDAWYGGVETGYRCCAEAR
jgi:hypothetical protein